jgi:4,5-DOPA dioxygenase extradiol
MSALGGDPHAGALLRFGERHRGLRAIVIVSAHWQTRGQIRVTTWQHAPILYDFGGFPDELYSLEYPAPGDPVMALRILSLVEGAVPEPKRGLDHGAWVPLSLAWPSATIPVVQVSLPAAAPEEIFALGRSLRPLRDEGVLIAGSGGIVHNLARVNLPHKDALIDSGAGEFDRWVAHYVARQDAAALFRYRTDAPNAAAAVPTSEHFDPLFVTLGAAWPDEPLETVFEGFHYGNISMRTFAFHST